ncbi:MAG: DUF2807 domain-containing protein [Flavobacteriales bacterium]|nr:DUF2807 domain-containing protein [Flavobacteriales bacterium]
MKNYKFQFTIILSSILLFTACRNNDWECKRAKGPIVEDIHEMNTIESVKLKLDADMKIIFDENANQTTLKVSGKENIMDKISIQEFSKELTIGFDGCYKGNAQISLELITPSIEGISLNGSGNITSSGTNTTELLEIALNGAGNIDLDLNVDQLSTELDGSGNISLIGTADDHDLEIDGSGDIKAFDLNTNTTKINIRGSGDADVNVQDYLEVKISGSGNVRYKGFPALEIDVEGSGDIISYN